MSAGCSAVGFYRPRRPQEIPLYRLVGARYEAVKGQWEERFEQRCGHWWGFVDGVVMRYLDCGRFGAGFARVQVAQAYSQLGGCDWSGCEPVNGQRYWRSDPALLQQIRHNVAAAIEGASLIFADGFEPGDLSAWSFSIP